MSVDIWSNESKIYPKIDAEGMRSGNVIIQNFVLGEDIKVDIKIQKYNSSDSVIRNSMLIRGLKISLNFRNCNNPFLRADNDHGGLHIHPNGATDYRKSLSEDTMLSQFISDVFDEAKKIIEFKFSKRITDGEGFTGVA